MRRCLSIVVGMFLLMSCCSVTAFAADAPEEVPVTIEKLSGPDLGKTPDGMVECTVEAKLSAPLSEGQSIVWTLNWASYTQEDTDNVSVQGTTSTFNFLVRATQDALITAQLLQGGEAMGDPVRLPVFKTYEAPEGTALVEGISGLPDVLYVGQKAEVTATLSQELKENESLHWIIDTGFLEDDGNTTEVVEGTKATLTFVAEEHNIGPHVLYAAVTTDTDDMDVVTSGVLQEFVIENAPEPGPALPEILEAQPDSPIDVEIEALEGGGCVVRGIPISTADQVTPVLLAKDIFVVPAGGSVTVLDADDQEVPADHPFATGQIVRVFDAEGQMQGWGQLVVKGDVAGTGTLSIVQLVRMAQALTQTRPLEGPYLEAGELSGSGTLAISDLVKLAKMLQDA